ncbi:NACHT N-terminal Helical domain 1-containing protein [Streptomyces violascens]
MGCGGHGVRSRTPVRSWGEATAVPGLEVVVLRLASAVVSTAAKSVLALRPGAGLVAGPLHPLPKPASPDRLAKVLGQRLTEAYGSLPEHERTAAVDAVRDGFAAAGELDAERLFALGLDPDRLAAELRRPHPGPGEPPQGVVRRGARHAARAARHRAGDHRRRGRHPHPGRADDPAATPRVLADPQRAQ